MLENFDTTDWIQESTNSFNIIGKNIGLKDLYKNENLEEYKINKLFINSKNKESIERLTCRIYTLIEKWFLLRKSMPKNIILSKFDYQRLINETNIIEDNCILGIKIDLLRNKKEKKYGTTVKNI